MAKTPTIFLSYSWANKDVADAIDETFKITGITMRRDVRDLSYRKSIKEFMNTIKEHNYVLVLISNEFIRSANCMYEVMELLTAPDFKDRILPLVIKGTVIFDPKGRTQIIKHWADKVKETQKLLKDVDPTAAASIQDDLKHYKNVAENIDTFISHIKDTNCGDLEELKKENYKPIFDLIGFDPKKAGKLEWLVKIQDLTDEEEQDIELNNYENNYTNDYLVCFLRGNIYDDRKKYKLSKQAYEKALALNPELASANNNYGLLLIDHFGDKEGAKVHYEKALALNPELASANNNYGRLLIDSFGDKEGAKVHYEKALALNPELASANNNYAILLIDHYGDKEGAKSRYEKALALNPEYASAHLNYAILLKSNFNDDKKALDHYKKAIALKPEKQTPERDKFLGFSA